MPWQNSVLGPSSSVSGESGICKLREGTGSYAHMRMTPLDFCGLHRLVSLLGAAMALLSTLCVPDG